MSISELSEHKINNLKDKAYRIIKEKIVNCELAPGELLNEKAFIEEIGTSRTPIREAINRLEFEKLIKIIPRKGIFVSDITVKDILEIYQVRETIDPLVTRYATPVIPKDKLESFKCKFENVEVIDFYGLIKLDHEFHNFIAQSCDNSYLLQLIDNIYAQNQRIRILSSRLPQRLIDSAKEHLNVISYMLLRNEDKEAQSMKEHILNSREAAFRLNYPRIIE